MLENFSLFYDIFGGKDGVIVALQIGLVGLVAVIFYNKFFRPAFLPASRNIEYQELWDKEVVRAVKLSEEESKLELKLEFLDKEAEHG